MTEVSVETCFLNSKVLSFSLNLLLLPNKNSQRDKIDNLAILALHLLHKFADVEGVLTNSVLQSCTL